MEKKTGLRTLTLGAPSWSTPNEVEAIKMYGLDKQPSWVLIMFFEGNDLFNTAQYLERQPTGLSWKEFDFQNVRLMQRFLTPHLFHYWTQQLFPDQEPIESRYRYPVSASTDEGDIQMVLKDIHLLPLSADYETLARSDELAYTKLILNELNGLCQAQGTRLLLVYIPSKEHVYWSRIWDPVDVNNILERTVTVTLTGTDQGKLIWEPRYLSFQTFNDNHNAQERLLEEIADQEGIEFLNLTPIFWTEGIRQGELYNFSDPHWNQAGNELAAETIDEYLQSH